LRATGIQRRPTNLKVIPPFNLLTVNAMAAAAFLDVAGGAEEAPVMSLILCKLRFPREVLHALHVVQQVVQQECAMAEAPG
jgi:hypothetical protein